MLPSNYSRHASFSIFQSVQNDTTLAYVHAHTLCCMCDARCSIVQQSKTSVDKAGSAQASLSYVMQNSVLGSALAAATSGKSGLGELSQLTDAVAFNVNKIEIQDQQLVFNADAQLSDETSLTLLCA